MERQIKLADEKMYKYLDELRHIEENMDENKEEINSWLIKVLMNEREKFTANYISNQF